MHAAILAAAASAVLAHNFRWRHHDPQLAPTLALALVAEVALVAFLRSDDLYVAFQAHLAFVAALVTSMTVYRLFFHPLRHVPSPSIFAKVTSAYRYRFALAGMLPAKIEQWHEQLGDVVRIGSNYVSVNDPAAIASVHALPKNRSWEAISRDAAKSPLLLAERSPVKHREKRAIFNPAFTPKALATYEEPILEHCDRLFRKLSSTTRPIDANLAMATFTFSTLVAVAMSADLDVIENPSSMPPTSEGDSFALLGFVWWLNWPIRTICDYLPQRLVPAALKAQDERLACARSMLAKRLAQEPARADLITIVREGSPKVTLTPAQLAGTALLVLAAGTSTTAHALTVVIARLLAHPDVKDRIRAEVEAAFPDRTQPLAFAKLAALPFLSAVITESMRLHSFVQLGSPRVVGEGGLVLPSGIVLKPGTEIFVPFRAISRRAASFDDPLAFKPERWMPNSTLKADPTCLVFFSTGRANCIGKGLAMAELRLVVARLCLELDLTAADAFDPQQWFNSCTGTSTLRLPPLFIKVSPRAMS